MFRVPEQFRKTDGAMATNLETHGNNGIFFIRLRIRSQYTMLRVIASDKGGWEHVSVSRPDQKVPTWDQMCRIKALFWDSEDCVVQFHPPESDYVNMHPGTLHLWRSIDERFPRPPRFMV